MPLELLYRVFELLPPGPRDYAVSIAPTAISIKGPTSVAIDAVGNIVATTLENRLAIIDLDGSLIASHWLAFDPEGAAIDDDGNVVVCDTSANRVVVLRTDGSEVTALCSGGHAPGELQRPQGLALDPLGHVVVAEGDNHRVQVLTRGGAVVRVIGSKGSGPGHFYYPSAVAVAPDGLIAVGDVKEGRVQLFNSDGTFLRTLCGWDDIGAPLGLAFDHEGNVVIADARQVGTRRGHERVMVFRRDGTLLWKCGSEGVALGQFQWPQGVAVALDGRIVVADTNNDRIQLL